MRPSALRVLIVAALSASALISTVARAEWPHDYRLPPPLLPGTGATNQVVDAAVADGSGGAYVFMEDDRSGNRDVYALHLRNNGTLDPGWPGTGLAVCTAAGDQVAIRALDDGHGGLWVCWTDSRSGIQKIYATRVLKNATIDSDFPANGLALDTGHANAQHDQALVLSPTGTLVAVWEYDFSPTDHDIQGAEVTDAGTLTWVNALQNSLLKDQQPDVSAEGGVFALVWQQDANCQFARHTFGSGAQSGPTQLVDGFLAPGSTPRVCPDGWGGSYVAFVDKVAGNYTVFVTRFFGGVAVTGYSGFDGTLGTPYKITGMTYTGNFQSWFAYTNLNSAIVAMAAVSRDNHGSRVPLPSPGAAANPQLTSDGSGGAILAAQTADLHYFVRAVRNNSTFGAPGLWGGNPPYVFELQRDVVPTASCSDGNSGALVFGSDSGIVPSLAYVMRVDRYGALDGAPAIQSVKDVANDQGGHVRVAWKASYLDRETDPIVDSYRLWRQVPVASAQGLQALRAKGAHMFAEDSSDPVRPGDIRIEQTASASIAWELVTTQIANAFPAYSLTVETVADSTGGGPANTLYMVEARYTLGPAGWASLPDSGHSVDNIPPAIPQPFTGAIQGGISTRLAWGANVEPDLAGYELYRGASAGFVPGPGNRVTATTDTTFLDASMGQFYKLAAFDVHGNHSGYALLTPGGTLDAPGPAPPRETALALASANPAVGAATLRYTLAQPGRVRLVLFGVDGRCARELVSGELPAGDYTARWDGRDVGGRAAPSGIYFARLSAAGRELVVRLALAH